MDAVAVDVRPSQTTEGSMSEFDILRSRQERLRDAVEDLQKEVAEKKKPWYRQPATLMSVAGTIFAVLSGIYTLRSAKTQDVSKNAADLHTIVDQLVQVHTEEVQDAATAKTDFIGYSTRSSLRNTKRLSLLEEADAKIAAASDQVSPSILIVLATEADGDGEYTIARKYLLQAVEKSQPYSPEKAGALFTLAQFCLIDGKALCGPDEGDRSYRAAIEQQPANSDSTHFARGELLTRIGLLVHYAHHDDKLANSYFQQAEADVAGILPTDTLRQQLAQYIATARTYAASSNSQSAPSFSNPDTFLGKWRILDPSDRKRTGTVTFVTLPGSPAFGAYVEVFEDDKLVEKQSGQVAVLDPGTLSLDWSSVGVAGQSVGYSRFSFEAKSNRIGAEQYRLGEAPAKFVLKR